MFKQDIVIPGQGVITAEACSPWRALYRIGSPACPARTWATRLDPALRDWLGSCAPANDASREPGLEASAKAPNP